jgi:hypothetical protein
VDDIEAKDEDKNAVNDEEDKSERTYAEKSVCAPDDDDDDDEHHRTFSTEPEHSLEKIQT